MALIAPQVTDLSEVAADFQALYVADEENGGYVLNTSLAPVAAAFNGHQQALIKARAEAKAKAAPTVDLSPLAEWGTSPQEIADRIAELKAKPTFNKEEAEKAIAKQYAAQIAARTGEVETLREQLRVKSIDNEAVAAIAQAKGMSGAEKVLLPIIRNQTRLFEEERAGRKEHVAYVVDGNGDVMYSATTANPKTIPELVAELKADGTFGRLFDSDAPTGGGKTPGSGNRAPRQNIPSADMSPAAKIAAGLANIKR